MDALRRLWAVDGPAGPAARLVPRVFRVLLGLVLFWPALGWSQFFGLDILPEKYRLNRFPWTGCVFR